MRGRTAGLGHRLGRLLAHRSGAPPEALQAYQVFHAVNYAHMVTVTFEPLTDLDAIAEDIAKG